MLRASDPPDRLPQLRYKASPLRGLGLGPLTGRSDDAALSSVLPPYVFPPSSSSPKPRCSHSLLSCVRPDGSPFLLLFGGGRFDKASERWYHLNDLHMFDCTKAAWAVVRPEGDSPGSIPGRRGQCMWFVESLQRVYVFGGIDHNDKHLNDLWKLDLEGGEGGNKWEQLVVPDESKPTERRLANHWTVRCKVTDEGDDEEEEAEEDLLFIFGGEEINMQPVTTFPQDNIYVFSTKKNRWSTIPCSSYTTSMDKVTVPPTQFVRPAFVTGAIDSASQREFGERTFTRTHYSRPPLPMLFWQRPPVFCASSLVYLGPLKPSPPSADYSTSWCTISNDPSTGSRPLVCFHGGTQIDIEPRNRQVVSMDSASVLLLDFLQECPRPSPSSAPSFRLAPSATMHVIHPPLGSLANVHARPTSFHSAATTPDGFYVFSGSVSSGVNSNALLKISGLEFRDDASPSSDAGRTPYEQLYRCPTSCVWDLGTFLQHFFPENSDAPLSERNASALVSCGNKLVAFGGGSFPDLYFGDMIVWELNPTAVRLDYAFPTLSREEEAFSLARSDACVGEKGDVTLVCSDDDEVETSRKLLEECSVYFSCLFNNPNFATSDNKKLNFPDFDSAVVKAVLFVFSRGRLDLSSIDFLSTSCTSIAESHFLSPAFQAHLHSVLSLLEFLDASPSSWSSVEESLGSLFCDVDRLFRITISSASLNEPTQSDRAAEAKHAIVHFAAVLHFLLDMTYKTPRMKKLYVHVARAALDAIGSMAAKDKELFVPNFSEDCGLADFKRSLI